MDLQVKNKKIGLFISDLVNQCIQEGVELKLSNKKYIMLSGIPCSGYFEGDVVLGKLLVATGKPQKQWLPILIHESCHLDQWLEDKEAFMEGDGIEIIDQWLNGNKIPKAKLVKAIENSKILELDCEKRSVEKIKKYKLPLNTQDYTQMANSYIYFYNWVLKNRKWVAKDKTLYVKEIYSKAPSTFQKSYKGIPKELEEAFNKYLL